MQDFFLKVDVSSGERTTGSLSIRYGGDRSMESVETTRKMESERAAQDRDRTELRVCREGGEVSFQLW